MIFAYEGLIVASTLSNHPTSFRVFKTFVFLPIPANPTLSPFTMSSDATSSEAASAGKFAPKQAVQLNPPKDDPFTVGELSKCDGTPASPRSTHIGNSTYSREMENTRSE